MGKVWIALAPFLLVLPNVASAQVLYGGLTGNVTDSSAAPVPDAKVEALNVGTGIKKETVTDARGVYLFGDLLPGTFRITITSGSFARYIQENVPIEANTQRRIDVQLQIAQVNEAISVIAAASALQTDRADVNVQLGRSQITNLPIGAGRNFQQLYKLIPGFTPPADAHSDAGNPQKALVANVNGVSYSNNTTRIDGATVSYPWLPHVLAYVPPAEAVETVSVVTNSFDAEQGMAGGAAINVIVRSGTNEFHGSGHWFHTNSVMKARNFFYIGDQQPKNLFNQFGGTFGGPIKKNKLFFFADWERTTRRQNANVFRTVPTDALLNGNFAGSGTQIYDPATGNADGSGRQLFANQQIPLDRFDSAVVKMNSLIPKSNLIGALQNNYFASGTYLFNRDNADIKVNYVPTDRAMIFARYSISPSDIFDPPSLGAAGGDALAGGQPGSAPGRVQSVAIGGTYTVSPRIVIDANIGFTRQRLGAQNVDIDKNYGLDVLGIPGTNGSDPLQGGYPRFVVSNFVNLGNPNISNPFLFRDNQWVAVANLSWNKGSHNIRFGGEYTYYAINHFQPQTANGPRGGFTFSGGLTALRGGAAPNLYNSWGDWLLGLPQSMGKDIQFINPSAVRMPGYGFYIRDQWQVTRRLTINYGTRFERYPFVRRDHRGGERYDPDTNMVLIGGLGDVPTDTGVDVGIGQLAPRIGIAYRATEKTVIRAGFGITIDPNTLRHMRDAYPAVISSQFSGNSTYEAAGSLRTGIPAVALPDLSAGMIPLPNAVGTQTFPDVFRRGYVQSFNFTIQRDIWAGFNLQAAYVGSRAIRQTTNQNINASGPGGGNTGRALYQKFPGRIGTINDMVPFNSARYDALQTQLIRRMSGGFQMGTVYTWSKSINYSDNSDSGLTFNWVPMLQRNRAVAGFDRTHNFQLYGVYELPFGNGKKWATSGIASALAGGWQINAVFSRTSGAPFNVNTAGASLNAQGSTQTADQVLAEVAIPGSIGRGQSYFDPNAFAPVTEVRFGNTGRNILRGPGLANLDASLFRTFQVRERFRMQFRAEVFNISNTPNFANPTGNGILASAATRVNGAITNTNGFGEVTTTSPLAPERQIRVALKLFF